MRFDIPGKPVRSILKVILFPGEELHTSPSARVMVEGALPRIQNRGPLIIHSFRAVRSETFLWLSPSHPGDIHPLELRSEGIKIRKNSYVAHFGPMDVNPHREMHPGMGEEWIIAKGLGIVWVSAPGPIEEIRLSPGEEVLVDGDFLLCINQEADMQILPGSMEKLVPMYLIKGPARLVVFDSRHSVRRGRGPGFHFFHIH